MMSSKVLIVFSTPATLFPTRRYFRYDKSLCLYAAIVSVHFVHGGINKMMMIDYYDVVGKALSETTATRFVVCVGRCGVRSVSPILHTLVRVPAYYFHAVV